MPDQTFHWKLLALKHKELQEQKYLNQRMKIVSTGPKNNKKLDFILNIFTT